MIPMMIVHREYLDWKNTFYTWNELINQLFDLNKIKTKSIDWWVWQFFNIQEEENLETCRILLTYEKSIPITFSWHGAIYRYLITITILPAPLKLTDKFPNRSKNNEITKMIWWGGKGIFHRIWVLISGHQTTKNQLKVNASMLCKKIIKT